MDTDGALSLKNKEKMARSAARANGATAQFEPKNQPHTARPTALLLSRHPFFPFLTIFPTPRLASLENEVGRQSTISDVIGGLG
ncbi:MAG: hypothetical protein JJ901_03345 [Erythrobacter sp.]|uniref:hypothetical protein n=1 Tax=Erythrobacter sp. TaxID=1042 RepID=UPI001B1D3069|nr:hypothetical protein [Erythrobacter sp.]MBO6767324.1 hypothetical protein [Erythrobacter sp.]